MNKKKKIQEINTERAMLKMRVCEYSPYYVFFLHFSFMTLQKHLDPECIVIFGITLRVSLSCHPTQEDYRIINEVNSCDPVPWGICLAFWLWVREGERQMPIRFEWLIKEKPMALADLCRTCGLYDLYATHFLPPPRKRKVKNEYADRLRGKFSRASLPIWKG